MKLRRVGADKAVVMIEGRGARIVDISGLNIFPTDPLDLEVERELTNRFENWRLKPKPQPQIRTAAADEELKTVRREKLRKIAEEITRARDRGFAETDKYIPSKGLELARQLDVAVLYMIGELNDENEIWARNWWTGHQEKITVRAWLTAMREIFHLRQTLRQHEQEARDDVEMIFNDESKSIDQRIAEIDALVIEPHLGLPEQASAQEIKQKLEAKRAARIKG